VWEPTKKLCEKHRLLNLVGVFFTGGLLPPASSNKTYQLEKETLPGKRVCYDQLVILRFGQWGKQTYSGLAQA